jgi:hypothetical protein
MQKPDRHIPFFHLLDAALQPGCVLCRLVATRTRLHVENILYECVNDVGFRDEWRAARGYCHRHAWILAEFGDGLGIGILYEDLVNSHGAALLTDAASRRCPLCVHEQHDLTDWVGQMERDWADDEMRAALLAGDGLCGPHLRVVENKLHAREVRDSLRETSLRTLERLKLELRALIDSYDYQHERPTEERVRLAWRRAIELLVGWRDVPG